MSTGDDAITTYTELHFHPLNPDPESISIEDIAHALSLTCRGNGQVKVFYSVAEHCLACAKEAKARGLSRRVVLGCLLHDAAESYLSDVPHPFKQYLKDYQKLEDRVMDSILEKLMGGRLTEEEWTEIREIDHAMLAYDLFYLLNEGRQADLPPLKVPYTYGKMQMSEAEEQYLDLYRSLAGMSDEAYELRKRRKPVSIPELLDFMGEDQEGMSDYLDLKTMEIVHLVSPDMGGDQETYDELSEALEEDSDRFLELPGHADLNDYDIMRSFAESLPEGQAERLRRAMHGSGAFRRFRAEVSRMGLEQQWYACREQACQQFAEQWCEDHSLAWTLQQK